MANRFLNNIRINDEYTLPATDGIAGQIIQTNGSGQLSFVNNTSTATSAEKVSLEVRFEEAVSKGDPVYVSGFHGSNGPVKVSKARSDDPDKMPAFGLADDDYSQNSTGHAISLGNLDDIDTGSYSVGDTLYVAPTGGLTDTKPTGSNLIQNVGTVSRSNQNNGSIEVTATGRSNDVPNLTTGKIWVGTATNTAESGVVHLDESNGRMGIGTTSPNVELEVYDSIATNTPTIKVGGAGNQGSKLELAETNNGSGVMNYGFSFFNDGNGTNTLQIKRHSNSTTGVAVITLNRDTSNVTFADDIIVSGDITVNGGDIILGGTGRIQGVDTVSANTDAANKLYVDNAVSGLVDGSGTANYIAKWSDADTITNSVIYDDGTNVGIGTTSPTNGKLEIQSSTNQISINTGTTGDGRLHIGHFSNGTFIGTYGDDGGAADLIRFGTHSGDERMRITSGGNVGIGTTSPLGKLHVENTAVRSSVNGGADNIVIEQNGYSGITILSNRAKAGQIHFGDQDAENIGMIQYVHSDNSMRFSTGNATEKMRINSSGNVGIGTTSPNEKLHVDGTSRFNGDMHFDSNTDGLVYRPVESGAAIDRYFLMFDETNNASYPFLTNRTPSGAVVIKTGTAAAGGENEHFRIEGGDGTVNAYFTNASVGIGTTSPDSKLEVAGSVHVAGNSTTRLDLDAEVKITGQYNGNSGSELTYLKMYNGSNASINIGTKHSLGYISFESGNGSYVERMRITNTGNVGIGTTTPGEKLEVVGNIKLSETAATIDTDKFAVLDSGVIKYRTGAQIISDLPTDSRYVAVTGDTMTGALTLDNAGLNVDGVISLTSTNTITTGNHIYRSANNPYYSNKRLRTYYERVISQISADPADYNTYYEIGYFNFTSLEGIIDVEILFNGSGFGQGSRHRIPVSYNMDYLNRYSLKGISTYTNVWLVADSTFQSPRHVLNNESNWELQFKVTGNTIYFRIVIKGSNSQSLNATAYIKFLHSNDFDNVTYNITTGTGTDSTTYDRLPSIISGINGKTLNQNTLIAGQVGIGTTSPTSRLEVQGGTTLSAVAFSGPTVKIGDYTGIGSTRIFSEGTNIGYSTANGYHDFTNAGASQVRITSTGNVGIGTTSPSYKLDVSGNSRIDGGLYITDASSIKSILDDNGTEGRFRLYNGSNWGLIARGVSNSPVMGAYHSGSFRISGFESSDGGTLSTYALATFNFGGSGGANGTLDLKGRLYINLGNDIEIGYSNYGGNGLKWQGTGKMSAAILPVDEQNYTRMGLGFFTGDSTTTPADATERMRITRDGKVGIGTTSPATLLNLSDNDPDLRFDDTSALTRADLNTEIGFYDSTGANGSYIGHRSSADLVMRSTAGAMRLGTFANSQLLNLVASNVGIGTTSPSTKLHIEDNTPFLTLRGTDSSYSNAGIQLISGNASNNRALGVFHYVENSDVEWFAGLPYSGNDAYVINRNTGFTSPSSQSSPPGIGASQGRLLTINSSGNVGIGTTSPNHKLHVSGNALATNLYLGTNIIHDGDTNTLIGFDTDTIKLTTSGSERLRVNSLGNVGIGTTGPTAKLHIQGTNSVNGGIKIHNSGGNPYTFWSDNDKLYISQGDGSTTAISVSYPGNVGVGTTNPRSKLDVNGGVRIADDTATASATNVGTLRYRADANNSYVDMCMQTGASTYEWINIVQNNW